MRAPRNLKARLNGDRIAALLLCALSLLYGWKGMEYTAALQVDVVGPAFYPTILSVLGVGLSIVLFVGSREQREAAERRAGWAEDLVALTPLALLGAYVLVLEPLGFPIATAIFLTLAFRYLRHPSWRGAILLAVVISAVSFALFRYALDVRLPAGLLAGVL
jgi:putative tricarboxylic transport membrane protein